ncbi:DUF6890 family protein [Oceanobacter mangrovi]|uniref:DUF6890 family protein n=1 Tax=Oceanobacter mangrovi TaxID=2862510 RepID=UPI001C8D58C9|nr:hypothetical protein [Oceanobacter mangrovi]
MLKYRGALHQAAGNHHGKGINRAVQALKENQLGQALVLARYYFNTTNPTEDELAGAVWLHHDLFQNQTNAIANGIAKAFSK